MRTAKKKDKKVNRLGYIRKSSVHTMQPLPQLKSLTNFFHRNRFLDQTHFLCGKTMRWSLFWIRTKQISFPSGAQQRRKKNSIERYHEKWHHKTSSRQKQGLPPTWTLTLLSSATKMVPRPCFSVYIWMVEDTFGWSKTPADHPEVYRGPVARKPS